MLMTAKYQIFGIGNALVDFEIETTPEELQSLSIDKGVMTLIEEDRQESLMKSFHGKHHSRACGGSAANTIIGAQSLGVQCFYSCRVADDEAGHFYKDDLLGHGVESNLATETLAEGKTGKCLVMITEDADRTMNTFLGITGDVSMNQVDTGALAQSEYLYVEGYLASSPVAVDAVAKAREIATEKGVKVAFSLSDPNMVKFCREGLDSIIADGVDILFCNYDEATSYTETANLEAALDKLSNIAKMIVVTLGPDGAVIFEDGVKTQVAGNAVEAIDTNGAGDLFAGSFLYGITSGYSNVVAGKLASFASSKLVTQFGPRLTEEKLLEVKEYDASLRA